MLSVVLLCSALAYAQDTGSPDTGSPDTGSPDTGSPDTGSPDTGSPDTGSPDTGSPDTGSPDTGSPDTGRPETVILSVTDASFSWSGTTTRDYAGEVVRFVGDIDGDGYDDMITGMRGYDVSATSTNVGAVAVLYNRAGASGTGNLSTRPRLTGRNVGEALGWGVAGVGDVNGDGYDDFAVSSRVDVAERGRTWLVYGRARRFFGAAPIASSGAASWLGEASRSNSGDGLAAAGDVDGDGYDDFLIGSNGADRTDAANSGAVHLVYGSAIAYTGPRGLANETSWWGEAAGDGLGSRYGMSHGDIDGDGLDDMVMGASEYGSGDLGAVYVWNGDTTRFNGTHAVGDGDGFLLGEDGGGDSRFGFAVSADGDVDGDGYDDLAVGAFYFDQPASQCGRGYLFYGGIQGVGVGVAANADVIVNAATAEARLGRDITIGGDLDDDGLDDLVLGMYRWGQPLSHAGATVIFMSARGLSGSYELTDADYLVEGASLWETAGYSVNSSGDLDADGRDDLILGAPGLNDMTGALHAFSGTAFD